MADTVLTDPRGREVVLLESTWSEHIVGNHFPWGPSLKAWREAVEQAVVAPWLILRSDPALHRDGEEYYGRAVIGGRQRLVKVCVGQLAVDGGQRRGILTAMQVRRIGRGEQLWP